MRNHLFAGLTSTDITPPFGLEMAGYAGAVRLADGVHDPLTASCLYLRDNRAQIAVVGIDLLYLTRRTAGDTRRKICAATGIPVENIMLCCSHTHSGPKIINECDTQIPIIDITSYENVLADKLIGIIVSARDAAFPCEIGFASAPCGREQGVGGNRLDPAGGPCDPNVYVLSVKDLNGTIRGLFVNYALHPTLLHADNTLYSADYPGYLRERLRGFYPQALTVFGLGAAGDQSSRHFRSGQTFGEARRFGYALADAARAAVENAEYTNGGKINVSTAAVSLKPRGLPEKTEAERLAREKQIAYERLAAAGAPYAKVRDAYVCLQGAQIMLTNIEKREYEARKHRVENERSSGCDVAAEDTAAGVIAAEDTAAGVIAAGDANTAYGVFPADNANTAYGAAAAGGDVAADVSLFAVGDISIASMPGEIFVEFALLLRRRSHVKKLIINTLTNGYLPGYVYTREEAARGGYETDSSTLGADAGYDLVDALEKLIQANKRHYDIM